ncbi:MAG: hypothetical protein SFU20_02030 [Chitinophagaceae bacterium]|nr:hypothetical protein [Chitinophagaceae bacterium]
MRNVLMLLLVLAFTQVIQAQTPITSYTIVNNTTVTTSSNSNLGWNAAAPYPTSTTYTHFYGQTNSGGNGLEREVTGFAIGAVTYSRMPSAGGLPFESVIVNRHPTSGGDTINALYEYTASSGNNLY